MVANVVKQAYAKELQFRDFPLVLDFRFFVVTSEHGNNLELLLTRAWLVWPHVITL